MIFSASILIGLCQILGVSSASADCRVRTAISSTVSSEDPKTARVLLSKFQSPSELACSQKCLHHQKCNYKKYDSGTKSCELLQTISKDDLAENSVVTKIERNDFCTTSRNSVCGKKCKCVNTCADVNKYKCDCSGQGVFQSCEAAMQANISTAAAYWVQPSLLRGAVLIKCNKSKNGEAFAVFHHNNEVQTTVKGYPDPAGSYKYRFSYETEMDTIASFISQSAACKQHTYARCKDVEFVSLKTGWINGSSGQQLKFWGGGPSNGTGCACGITNSCVDKAHKCNCDANMNTWQIDEGYVTDKDVLPITGIAIGDTAGPNEQLDYIVGPLFCLSMN